MPLPLPAAEVAPAAEAAIPTTPPPLDPATERLLIEAQASLAQGIMVSAEQALAGAKKLAPEHPAVLETEGDIARAKGLNLAAERLYRQAFQADRGNARLEEKFATALVKIHEPEYRALPDDSPWSNRMRRAPAISCLMSAFFPGLGQFYNGDYLKGGILAFIWTLLLWQGPAWGIFDQMFIKHNGGVPVSFGSLCAAFCHGWYLLATLLALGLWVYSLIDAVKIAQNPD